MSKMEYGRWGRCLAYARSAGRRCKRNAMGPHGKCDKHGGKSPKGKDSPNFVHGLFSDYLDEEDRWAMGALEDIDDAGKLEELVNWRLARLRRYLREMSDEEEYTFWEAYRDVLDATQEVTDDEIRALASMLDRNNRAVQDEIDLVRKLIKDHHKIAEGDTVQVEHSGQIDGERTLGEDEKTAIRQALDPGQ